MKIPTCVKDIFIAGFIVGIILIAMYLYTQVWPPLVVIESNSMTHENAGFGKIGTIDAGDFVLVKKIHNRAKIITCLGAHNYNTYGAPGDVVVYYPYGNIDQTPVIHRVMFWVEVNEYNNIPYYTIPELNIVNVTSITLPTYGLHNYEPANSGFITQGDNNRFVDQAGKDICTEPIKFSWIIGVARYEIPWFGLVKLLIDDVREGTNNAKNGSLDCWLLLIISFVVIFLLPNITLFVWKNVKDTKYVKTLSKFLLRYYQKYKRYKTQHRTYKKSKR